MELLNESGCPTLPRAVNAFQHRFKLSKRAWARVSSAYLVAVGLIVALCMAGCGTGGYPGGGVMSLSQSSIVLDAGQSIAITADVTDNAKVSWTFVGSACSGSACGSLSATSGAEVSYSAPTGIVAPMHFNLAAAVAGTTSQKSVDVTVNPAPTLGGTLPSGIVGTPYSAKIVAAGGTPAATMSVLSGSLPAGLTFNATTGVISGVPTSTETSTFVVQLVDSSMVPFKVTANESITIAAATLKITGILPVGTVGVPYSTTITATGGIPPYTCAVTGALPAGLNLNGCVISGTPTRPGSFPVTIIVTDSGSPAQSTSITVTIVINPALILTTSTLPDGTVGVPYVATIGVSGGSGPYTCTITAGTLPAGLKLAGCIVSGTPTVAGTSPLTVKVVDSENPAQTVSGPQSITIHAAPLKITGTLPVGTVGKPYSTAITATGGTAPYTCSIVGTLPNGLILNGCGISGTPTKAGSYPITITVTDSGNPAQTASITATIVINADPLALTNSSLPNGAVGVPYSATIGVSGGTSPYACTITAGTLPAGLSLSGCAVSGTPTTPGTSPLTVKVVDSSNPAQMVTGPQSITIDSSALTLTSTLPNGTVGVSYSSTITAAGGAAPYTCSVTGTLPAGLALSACTVSGIPTQAETSTVTVRVTDSGTPRKSGSGQQSITIAGSGSLSLTANLPVATVSVAYSYSLHATGGTPAYTYALTSGALPAGITLQSDGVIAGTPTAPGASSFTATVTDSTGTTASLPLVLLVDYAQTPYDAELTGPYAFLFQGYDDVVAGVLAYQTGTVGSFTADGLGGINSGELDANHQSSNPAATTIAAQNFLGTYVINSDSRGMVTITTLDAHGNTDQTFTYAISLKAPTAPATASTQGSLIEFDNNQLVGTKGSGSLLAQTPAQFATAFNGSFAFGLSGDTPCLLSCTVGLASGPVAAVGQFTTDNAGALTSGVSDVNVATVNLANAPLTGSYQPADSNGRIQLAMTNTSVSDGLYPTNFAVYVVNANQAFILSTDKHSQYDLLAGTAQRQSSSTFTNTAMASAFVGYENAPTDPGLLGTTLQGVLNFSSATIFRASGDGTGNCTTTNVDSGGLTNLVNSLTGLGATSKNNLITALLGSYDATGTSSCTVSQNGRGQLNYPEHSGAISLLLELLGLSSGPPSARVFYLTSPATGYFLETSYAGLGQFEAQTGFPFSNATLSGTFVDQNAPASSLASVDQSGYFSANGAGRATHTLDENIGVGTLNVLQLGVTGSTTYSLSDSNGTVSPSTAGRFVLGDNTTVLYAISPEKFVMVDTSPLITSPAITLLY
jgi:hypothetical protein